MQRSLGEHGSEFVAFTRLRIAVGVAAISSIALLTLGAAFVVLAVSQIVFGGHPHAPPEERPDTGMLSAGTALVVLISGGVAFSHAWAWWRVSAVTGNGSMLRVFLRLVAMGWAAAVSGLGVLFTLDCLGYLGTSDAEMVLDLACFFPSIVLPLALMSLGSVWIRIALRYLHWHGFDVRGLDTEAARCVWVCPTLGIGGLFLVPLAPVACLVAFGLFTRLLRRLRKLLRADPVNFAESQGDGAVT